MRRLSNLRWLLIRNSLFGLLLSLLLFNNSYASEDPAVVIDNTVKNLLGEFTESKDRFESDKGELFDMVGRIAGPLFDFSYISKLILGKNWKTANDQQKSEFAIEFKRLLIVTYATALFQYSGEEEVTFGETGFREKRGVKFAKVNTEVKINDGAPIPVVYDLMLDQQQNWDIYNLTVGNLNMVLNYRNVFQAAIHSNGLDDVIASMRENNQKNYHQ